MDNNDNNKESYIVLNGVKVEISDELAKQLQDGVKEGLLKNENINTKNETNKVKNLFKRVSKNNKYTITCADGSLGDLIDIKDNIDNDMFDNINYFPKIKNTNLDILLSEYFHKKNLIQRKMMKFSLLHDGYKVDWNNYNSKKFYIHLKNGMIQVSSHFTRRFGQVYFYSEEIAQQFIDENEAELLESIELEKKLFKSINDYCEE